MEKLKVGRLALRVEDDCWVAYFAASNTMVGAIWLGAIDMSTMKNPVRKQQFMDLMCDVVADILEAVTKERPAWMEPVPAPEHER